MPSGQHAFVADAAERLIAPPARARSLARLAIATLAALALELGAFALIYFERRPPPPAPEPIPVEIVVEPEPPPPPPPPPPQASPQAEPQAQAYEKPATDAPREGKSDHDDENVAEKPKPAAAPPPPAPTPSPEASKPVEAPAPELAKAKEAEAPPPAKAEPTPAPAPPKPAVLAALPKTFESVPDVDFGGEAMKSPVSGGAAKATYFSILYGLVVPRLRVPAIAHAYGRRLTGAVAFMVDGRGRLTQRFVVESSGSMELDEAAMQAVADASHAFPPPPHGAPIGMKFTYTVN